MSSALATADRPPAAERPIRVMIVDDAVVARGMMTRWVEAEPDMQIAAVLRSGREALDQVVSADPDVVLLDVEMPDLDGIAALPLLLEKKRGIVVIMVSTLTRRSAELSFRALALGATDYIPKPESASAAMSSATFRRELIDKIRGLGRRRLSTRSPYRARALPGRIRNETAARPGVAAPASLSISGDAAAIKLRPFAAVVPRVLLFGASTGGPQALSTVLEKLPGAIDRAPVLITQHMPPTFTTVLAERLSRIAARGAHEAEHGEVVLPGGIYLAPGARHMRVTHSRGSIRIVLGDDPPINFCKPAVDPLFASAAEVWGAATLAVVLTGMGSDGCRGAAAVASAGGSVIAQDEASSVVWGMPRAVTQAGLCSAVLPLDQIAPRILRLFSGDRL